MMKSVCTVSSVFVVALMVFGATEPALSAITYPLQLQTPTAPPFHTNNPVDCSRGWRFVVNSPGVEVVQLGVDSVISSSVSQTVTLFDFATHDVLAQVTTTPGPGWLFVNLPSPVALTEGNQYVVSAFFPSPGGYYYAERATVGDSWFPTGTIQYLDMRYANDATPSTFPTYVLTDYQYGIPDIGYQVGGAAIPAPGALLLAAMGTGLVGLLRRRKAV